MSWAVLSPTILWATYQLWPPDIAGQELDILSFLILMSIVAFLPIIVNETPVFFIHGISLAVFLSYGIFMEMILVQAVVIALLIKLRVGIQDLFRYPINSLMFMFVSFISGSAYYLLGGQTGAQAFSPIFIAQVVTYSFVVCAVNHYFLQFVRKFIYKKSQPLLSTDFIWEIFTTSLVFPVGLILYLLYIELGLVALFYVGVPFIILSVILKLYYASQKVNSYLQEASEIGHQLTERLNVGEVLNVFLEKITKMIEVDYAFIIDTEDSQGRLKCIREYRQGERIENSGKSFSIGSGVLRYVYENKKTLQYKKKTQWKHLGDSFMPEGAESLMAVPVIRNQKVVGAVLLISHSKRAFQQYQLILLDLLTAHLGVAIENAKNYEKTRKENERCSLTGLYNYRYFEKQLTYLMNTMNQGRLDRVSLILLDIDHFKLVNDTYGHQAGNEILIELAERLRNFIGNKGTVARYGGEEFVIILPNTGKRQCFSLAEGIRSSIAQKPFMIQQHIFEEGSIPVQITASLGIASAPEDADEPLALIRHADRAMYTGAKKAGRNKVAEYAK
ncbi:diguanylate cyclase [Bacillus lacus]|uniref:Diguanylate cyclase n=2 Tax=Metabacillus lacus TaxID=1983721 RepID=A0A7X2J2A3_9BACI|nr:sensor domain-containing diguanylate cyclase [Metabacillus lacus]MRX74163.1 diguanylate cyclase [Metabacillus lacus]